ncbi:MAG: aminoacetone oxidase family FAD-binding enzyme [Lachnospiraceae bacterium]|nr:aminoacetone oxidase family FAD-binding enzyme [Lachnospiraceae bacterium]
MNENRSSGSVSLAVIGGGYGGLCAAVMASACKIKVTVFERQDKPLKKIALTGNGRCNISNENISINDYVTDDRDTLDAILSSFNREEENRFFSILGLGLRSDESRLYPVTGKALSVMDALKYKCNESGVSFVCDHTVTAVLKRDDHFEIRCGNETYDTRFDLCILACGGAAGVYKENSSNGFDIVKKLGHTIKPVYPALTKVICSADDQKALKKLDGIRVRADLKLLDDKGDLMAEESGELQMTATGLSGIPVFDLTRYMKVGSGKAYRISVDLLPGFTGEMFDERMKLFPLRTPETFFTGLLLPAFVPFICGRCNINIHKRMGDLSDNEVSDLINTLHDCIFDIEKTGDLASAQISTGGVPLSEVDLHMRSKKVNGLYIIGEMLDVAGRCGGFNLHFAASGAFNAVKDMNSYA